MHPPPHTGFWRLATRAAGAAADWGAPEGGADFGALGPLLLLPLAGGRLAAARLLPAVLVADGGEDGGGGDENWVSGAAAVCLCLCASCYHHLPVGTTCGLLALIAIPKQPSKNSLNVSPTAARPRFLTPGAGSRLCSPTPGCQCWTLRMPRSSPPSPGRRRGWGAPRSWGR